MVSSIGIRFPHRAPCSNHATRHEHISTTSPCDLTQLRISQTQGYHMIITPRVGEATADAAILYQDAGAKLEGGKQEPTPPCQRRTYKASEGCRHVYCHAQGMATASALHTRRCLHGAWRGGVLCGVIAMTDERVRRGWHAANEEGSKRENTMQGS